MLQEAQTTKDLDLAINFVLDQVLTLEQLMIAIIYHIEAVDQGKSEGLSKDVHELMNIIWKYKNRPSAEQDNIKIFTEYKQEFRD